MSLDPDSLQFQAETNPSAMLAALAEVEAFDRLAERRLRGYTLLPCCLPLGFLLLSMTYGVADRASGGSVVCLTIAVTVFLALFVKVFASGVKAQTRSERQNLEDRRYRFARELLELLAADLSPRAPLALRLDLEAASAERKRIGAPTQRGQYGVVRTSDDWLDLHGRLGDGTAFRLEARDATEFRTHPRKAFKNKRKTVTRLALRLRPRPARYRGLNRLGKDAAAAVRLPEGWTLKKLRVTPGDLRITVAAKSKVQGSQVLPGLTDAGAAVFLSAYQILNLSRAGTKGGLWPAPPAGEA